MPIIILLIDGNSLENIAHVGDTEADMVPASEYGILGLGVSTGSATSKELQRPCQVRLFPTFTRFHLGYSAFANRDICAGSQRVNREIFHYFSSPLQVERTSHLGYLMIRQTAPTILLRRIIPNRPILGQPHRVPVAINIHVHGSGHLGKTRHGCQRSGDGHDKASTSLRNQLTHLQRKAPGVA